MKSSEKNEVPSASILQGGQGASLVASLNMYPSIQLRSWWPYGVAINLFWWLKGQRPLCSHKERCGGWVNSKVHPRGGVFQVKRKEKKLVFQMADSSENNCTLDMRMFEYFISCLKTNLMLKITFIEKALNIPFGSSVIFVQGASMIFFA
jgi:hypothetical protein